MSCLVDCLNDGVMRGMARGNWPKTCMTQNPQHHLHLGQESISAFRFAFSHPYASIHLPAHSAKSCAVEPFAMSSGGGHLVVSTTGGGSILAGATCGFVEHADVAIIKHATDKILAFIG